MKTTKTVWSITILLITIAIFLVTLACGGSSDGSGDDEPSASGGISGGYAPSTGGSSGGSTSTGGIDGGQRDGAVTETEPELPKVGAGEQCTMPYSLINNTATLFTAYGTCQDPSAECVGGTPDQLDLAPILPASLSMLASLLPEQPDAAANCESGLVCCIEPGTCTKAGEQLASGIAGTYRPGIGASCKTADSCPATNEGESAVQVQLTIGCESGEICCLNLPELNLDAGVPGATTDASTEATKPDAATSSIDAGAQQ